MQVARSIAEWRDAATRARAAGHRVGLVPTMGALHAGHLSLIDRARRECDVVLVTIFVNPRQFNDDADLAAYPRDLERDLALCTSAGVDVVAAPELAEMWPSYPQATATVVHVAGLADAWECEGRPGHFDGVASVVAKLFAVTGPCRAYFGEKDFQQLAVVRTMVSDLSVPVELVGCEIVREEDGLALSSRNSRLSPSGRVAALSLSRAVALAGAAGPASGPERGETARREMSESGVEVAYATVVDPVTFRRLGDREWGEARVLVAGVVEGVRLLDNGPVSIPGPRGE